MTSDERFQREVTLGKRIGFYKFRGDLGTGNFARVKLAFHQLAHGKPRPQLSRHESIDNSPRETLLVDTSRHCRAGRSEDYREDGHGAESAHHALERDRQYGHAPTSGHREVLSLGQLTIQFDAS